MIKENQKLLNRIQVVLDAGVIIVAYVLSWYIRFRSGLFDLDPWYLSESFARKNTMVTPIRPITFACTTCQASSLLPCTRFGV